MNVDSALYGVIWISDTDDNEKSVSPMQVLNLVSEVNSMKSTQVQRVTESQLITARVWKPNCPLENKSAYAKLYIIIRFMNVTAMQFNSIQFTLMSLKDIHCTAHDRI